MLTKSASFSNSSGVALNSAPYSFQIAHRAFYIIINNFHIKSSRRVIGHSAADFPAQPQHAPSVFLETLFFKCLRAYDASFLLCVRIFCLFLFTARHFPHSVCEPRELRGISRGNTRYNLCVVLRAAFSGSAVFLIY